jgi:hypothetical protein
MLSLSISILFIFASALIDKEVLEYSYIYSHRSRAFQRALFFGCLALFSITGAIGGVFLFMALFDGILNKLRKIDLFYVGTTAKWDIFFREKPFLYIFVKVISLFTGIYLCLI